MENQKKLHEYGLCLVILAIVDIFNTITSTVASFFNGNVDKMIASAETAEVANLVKPNLITIIAVAVILSIVQLLIGVKGMKISKNPTTAKGYYIAAFVFLILDAFAIISNAIEVFSDSNPDAFGTGMTLSLVALEVCVYALFIKAAEAVRKDALNK